MEAQPAPDSVDAMPGHLRLASDSGQDGAQADSATIRVLLADDRDAVRHTLRLVLDGEDGVEVVAEAGDIDSVIRHLGHHLPTVVVLDLQMPSGSSVETIRTLRERSPTTELVVMTMQASPAFARQVLDAGAAAFVLKEHADVDLPVAVRAAARGEEFVSPRVEPRLRALRRAVGGDGLTQREVEVLQLTALGHTGGEIAVLLKVSRRTVEAHRARIYAKVGLSSRAELVRYALGRKLISA
jgi:two-component system, NarL family, response regulator NreC